MEKFNERAVLVFSVVGLFAIQVAIFGYQSLTCSSSQKSGYEHCIKKNESFSKIGESAANVFLALLVPAAYASGRKSSNK